MYTRAMSRLTIDNNNVTGSDTATVLEHQSIRISGRPSDRNSCLAK